MLLIITFLYCFSGVFLLSNLYIQVKYSVFGFLFFTFITWHFFAFSLAPIIDLNNVDDIGFISYQYYILNGKPGFLTALHIFSYTLFSLISSCFILNRKINYDLCFRIEKLMPNPEGFLKVFIVIGVLSNIIYFYNFGFKNALMLASSMRAKHYDGDTSFLFLKSISYVSLYAVCFIPYICKSNLRNKNALIFFYVSLVLMAYLNSVSRTIVLTYLIIPILMIGMMSVKAISFKKVLVLFFTMLIGTLVLFYGKSFGNVMSSFIDGRDAAFVSQDLYFIDVLLKLVSEQSYLWYSVDAGMNNFFHHGFYFPIDVFLSVFGFIPSSVLNSLGLGFLNFDSVDVTLSCYNSMAFSLNDCTVPTRFIGYTSYFFPIGGGVLYGVLVGSVMSSLNKLWKLCQENNLKTTWAPYLLWLIFSAFLTFVPNTISRACFVVFIMLLVYFLFNFLNRLSSR